MWGINQGLLLHFLVIYMLFMNDGMMMIVALMFMYVLVRNMNMVLEIWIVNLIRMMMWWYDGWWIMNDLTRLNQLALLIFVLIQRETALLILLVWFSALSSGVLAVDRMIRISHLSLALCLIHLLSCISFNMLLVVSSFLGA